MYKFQCYNGIFLFPLDTFLCIRNNKTIKTFTFTFSVTHFNFTQLLFWILALLDLSFLLQSCHCPAYFFHCLLHIFPFSVLIHLSNSFLYIFMFTEISSLHTLLFFFLSIHIHPTPLLFSFSLLFSFLFIAVI